MFENWFSLNIFNVANFLLSSEVEAFAVFVNKFLHVSIKISNVLSSCSIQNRTLWINLHRDIAEAIMSLANNIHFIISQENAYLWTRILFLFFKYSLKSDLSLT